MSRRAALLVVLALAATHCKPKSAGGAASSQAPPPLAPLVASSWIVDLDVPGFDRATAAVPLGATESRPVVLALHGGADRPEWACGTWVGVTRSHAFVLCPRGIRAPSYDARDPRYGWGTSQDVENELRAALRALKARFGHHVASGPVVLAAFAAGTRPAADIVKQEPSFFARVVFVDPLPEIWSAGLAGVYRANGGQRLLFVCTDPSCKSATERYFILSRGAGVSTQLIEPGDYGRVLDDRVATAISNELAWFLGGAPFWPNFAPAPAASASSR